MSEFTEEIGYNGQNATALITSSRSRFADGGRVTLPNCKPIPTLTPKQVAKFWSNVEKRAPNGCWQWLGAQDPSGYGSVCLSSKNVCKAHRVAYVLVFGEIPVGLTIDHLCRNRTCVNPSHLEPVTHRENTLRGVGPTAVNARQMLCREGHQLSGSNLVMVPNNRRRLCQICEMARKRVPRRITQSVLVVIKKRLSEGASHRQIARELGMSHTTITRALARH